MYARNDAPSAPGGLCASVHDGLSDPYRVVSQCSTEQNIATPFVILSRRGCPGQHNRAESFVLQPPLLRLDVVCTLPRKGRTVDVYSLVPCMAVAVAHSMPASQDPQQNHLLAALSPAERDRLYPHLRLVPMPLGKVLYESGDVLRHVYFPTNSIVSLLYVLADGASAEISVVGNEGLIGIALFMGGETTPSRAIVQSAGHAYRLIGQQLKEEFHRNGEMQLLLLRYTQALITQMAQTAVCNRHHSVDQQLCRWLLLSLDRLSSNQLTMTQELIANMLGVRREGVTEAAGKLHKLGVIRYARGQITVLDRPQAGTAVLRVLRRRQEGN